MLVDVVAHNCYKGNTPPRVLRSRWFHFHQHTVVLRNLPAQATWWTLLANTDLPRDPGLLIPLDIGISKCHWRDSYSRRRGRELATADLHTSEWYLTSVSFLNYGEEQGTKLEVNLTSATNTGLILRLSYSGKNLRPHAQLEGLGAHGN